MSIIDQNVYFYQTFFDQNFFFFDKIVYSY